MRSEEGPAQTRHRFENHASRAESSWNLLLSSLRRGHRQWVPLFCFYFFCRHVWDYLFTFLLQMLLSIYALRHLRSLAMGRAVVSCFKTRYFLIVRLHFVTNYSNTNFGYIKSNHLTLSNRNGLSLFSLPYFSERESRFQSFTPPSGILRQSRPVGFNWLQPDILRLLMRRWSVFVRQIWLPHAILAGF